MQKKWRSPTSYSVWKTTLILKHMAHVIEHGLQGSKVQKNIKVESTDENDLSRILWQLVCGVNT